MDTLELINTLEHLRDFIGVNRNDPEAMLKAALRLDALIMRMDNYKIIPLVTSKSFLGVAV